MQKVLILGHKGMLGDAVFRYLKSKTSDFTVITTNERWETDTFKKYLTESEADSIINCIGLIPQKKPLPEEYTKVNINLPVFLESLGKKIIHPSTDCEFSGSISVNKKYSKEDNRDAEDIYGKSKATISNRIENTFSNTKIIRTSIIGHETNSKLSLLEWFLNSETTINGYINHYWNGITTLEWSKICEEILNNWDNFPTLNQYGTEGIRNKYNLLNDIKNVYSVATEILPFNSSDSVNKQLISDKEIRPILIQLQELKEFYKK